MQGSRIIRRKPQRRRGARLMNQVLRASVSLGVLSPQRCEPAFQVAGVQGAKMTPHLGVSAAYLFGFGSAELG